VWASGRVQIAVNRPAPVGTVFRILLSPIPGNEVGWEVETVEMLSSAFYARHVEVAREAVTAMVGRKEAFSWLASASQRALPDKM
ncbi:MAG: hypothetical protein AAB861_00610, partial [Patescibacteria group bacterium]